MKHGKVIDIYPLSPLQKGFIFHALYDRHSSDYFEQLSYRIHKELDIQLMRETLQLLFERHDILRTAFLYENVQHPVQVVLKQRDISFHFEDQRNAGTAAALNTWLQAFRAADRNNPFDLKKDTLLRCAVIQVEDHAYEVIWSFPHIILDGWSLTVLNTDFWDIYTALEKGERPHLPAPPQYKSYIQLLEKNNNAHFQQYWTEYLDGYEQLAGVPQTKTKTTTGPQAYAIEEYSFDLDTDTTAQLQDLALQHHVTLYVLTQAIWAIVLAKYNDVRDVVFGTVVSGRPPGLKGIESMVGLFINTLPLRIRSSPDDTFGNLIERIMKVAIESEQYQYSSLAELQAGGRPAHQLFDHILVFENYPTSIDGNNASREEDAPLISNLLKYTSTNYDLNMIIIPGDTLRIRINYNSNVYDRQLIQRTVGHFAQVARQVIQQPQILVDDIRLLTPGETRQVIHLFNNSRTDYPDQETIQGLFEARAAKTPANMALVTPAQSLTYQELNEAANTLAHHLKAAYQIRPDDMVGVMADRTTQSIICILAILKAGAAYVPIDPAYPRLRIQQMLEGLDLKVLLTTTDRVFDLLNFYTGPLFATDLQLADIPVNRENPVIANSSADLAYMIFTSGSTGKPKGVMIEQRSVLRLVQATNYVKLKEGDRLLQTGALSFDASTFEIWGMLLNGGTLHLLPYEQLLHTTSLKSKILLDEINIMWFTSSWFNQLADEDLSVFGRLEQILVGGDKLSPKHINKVQDAWPSLRIINGYGPTENTTFSVCHQVTEKYEHAIPIGIPVSNSTAYILDSLGHPVPIGIAGELHLGGDGVARGYYGNEAATLEKFILDPFMPQRNGRLYRSGDLCRWLPDGNIEFLGRKDNQVKIRGFRIEPGDIENALAAYDGIEKVFAVTRDTRDCGKEIIVYYTGKASPPPNELLTYLEQRLPEYMVPAHLILLPAFPLTLNGKIDHTALPDPDHGGQMDPQTYVPPGNHLEEQLVAIWEEVLGKIGIGITDDFFRLGGHSLKAVQIISRVSKEMNIKIELKNLFTYPTIAGLSGALTEVAKTTYEGIPPVATAPWYELSHAQQRLWVAAQLEKDQTTYNIPVSFDFEETLQPVALEKAFETLIDRHESLRTTFLQVDGIPRQQIRDAGHSGFKIVFLDISNEQDKTGISEKMAFQEAMTPFNLETGPLLRVRLIRLQETHYKFLFTIHHIIADFLSMQILVKEILELYKAYSTGTPDPLPALPIQYKDYAAWHNHQLQQDVNTHRSYWLDQFTGGIPVLDFPADHPRPKKLGNKGKFVSFTLDAPTAEKIKKISGDAGATTFITLLTMVYVLLYKYSGQTDLVIGTPIAGREHMDLEGQIGFFVNMLALRNRLKTTDTFSSLLNRVKDNTFLALTHQLYPFDLLVEDLTLTRDPSRNPLFDLVVTTDILEGQDDHGEGHNGEIDKTFNICKYDLRIRFSEIKEIIAVNILYNAELFKRERILILQDRFISLVKGIIADPALDLDRYDWEIGSDLTLPVDILTADFHF